MKRLMIGTAALSLGFVAVLGGQAVSQTPGPLKPDQIIAARQAGMDLTDGVVDAMKAGAASGADLKPFVDGAGALVKWGKAYPALFPEDTKTGNNTKAKPEIWSDWAGFEKAAANFVTAGEKLQDTAKSGDKAAFATALQGLGQTCGGCHRNYKNR